MSIKLMNAALEERDGDVIVLRGRLDPGSLHALKVGEYQREVLGRHQQQGLQTAIMLGRTPDVILGMRGQRYTTRKSKDDADKEDFFLVDEVYIIDGLQRVSVGRKLVELGGKPPQIGALVYFNSNEKFELEQFTLLNTTGTRLSPNIKLRNLRATNLGIQILCAICEDKNSAVFNRVAWKQGMGRDHLITAATLAKVSGRLHPFTAIGGLTSSDIMQVADALDKVAKQVGPQVFKHNVQTFLDVVEAAWGLRSVAYKKQAIHLRAGFLFSLSAVFSKHENFWQGQHHNRLFVSRDDVHKLKKFKLDDPNVKGLANSGGGEADKVLAILLAEHLDKGKQKANRLKRRGDADDDEENDEGQPQLINGKGERHAA